MHITTEEGSMKGYFLQKWMDSPKMLVLACAVMEQEIRRFQNGKIEFKFFDYGLHRTPENMSKVLQMEIDQIPEEDYDGIVLGYGLCSNGIVGICAHKHLLIVPRIHDCISLFLGSTESYRDHSTEHPGTYYLTPGWIEKGETPISKFNSYAQSYGEETARWVLHEEMKNYTRILLINTAVYDIEPYRKIARQNAAFLGVSYEEIQGSSALFRSLVMGPRERDFLIMERGQVIQQEVFLDL
jgi:hypothetical protein